MHVTIHADGCCRPNPGQASCGAVLHTSSETIEISHHIGEGTSNIAEWTALIVALQQAAEIGATSLDVRMDSRLVVMQASGRWKPKHPRMRASVWRERSLCRRLHTMFFAGVSVTPPAVRCARVDLPRACCRRGFHSMSIGGPRSSGSTGSAMASTRCSVMLDSSDSQSGTQ